MKVNAINIFLFTIIPFILSFDFSFYIYTCNFINLIDSKVRLFSEQLTDISWCKFVKYIIRKKFASKNFFLIVDVYNDRNNINK